MAGSERRGEERSEWRGVRSKRGRRTTGRRGKLPLPVSIS
jgi:hypothetical protein